MNAKKIINLLKLYYNPDATVDDYERMGSKLRIPNLSKPLIPYIIKMDISNDAYSRIKQIYTPLTYNGVLDFIMKKPFSYFAEDFNPLPIQLPSISEIASKKTNAALEQLNANQRSVIFKLHKMISDSLDSKNFIVRPFFATLNARSGTGKSTTISVLACSLLTQLFFVVYSNYLCNYMRASCTNIITFTTCGFIMKTLGVKYYDAIRMFNVSKSTSLCVYFQRMINYMETFSLRRLSSNSLKTPYLFVFDEYSISAPMFLIFIHMLSRKFNLNVLMVGDANQQKPINRSVYHKTNNYHLLERLSDSMITLNEQMRMTSKQYIDIISKIEERLDSYMDNVRMSFDQKYLLYTLLRSHFHMKENYRALYLANIHKKLKQRIEECYKYAITKKIKIDKLLYTDKNGRFVHLPSKDKYPPILLLIEGFKYIRYTNDSKFVDIVTYNKVLSKDKILVTDSCNTKIVLERVPITTSNTGDECYEWLTSNGARSQFPLRFSTSTYYSAQGVTWGHPIELDIDDASLNSVYVGLTRIRDANNLCKLHTKDLYDLHFTYIKNDDFFYKTPPSLHTKPCHQLVADGENMKIQIVEPKEFERTKMFAKVCKSEFEEYIRNSTPKESILLNKYKMLLDYTDAHKGSYPDDLLSIHNTLKCDCDIIETQKEEDLNNLRTKSKKRKLDVVEESRHKNLDALVFKKSKM